MRFWHSKKQPILIFGTGAGGMNFYKNCRSRYRVVGFLDNNKQKQGKQLFGVKIYAPQELAQLVYDKIVIASDYYAEIYQQLTLQLGIDEDRLEVFHASELIYLSRWRYFKNALRQYALNLMCRRQGWCSSLLFYCFYGRVSDNNVKLMPCDWLDKQVANRIHVFREPEPAVVVGPDYLDRPQARKSITLPAVALYHFANGQVCSVSRSVILPEDRIIVERVEPGDAEHADYSCAHLLFHGQSHALVRKEQPELLEKGVLITGGSETNYYHWMLEVLSQLQFIDELPAEYADYPLLMSASGQKIPAIQQFLDAANIQREIIYLKNITSYRIADVLLINSPNNLIPNLKNTAWSQVDNSYVRAESINYLRKIAFSVSESTEQSVWPTRVFLARKGFIRHYNQDEIIAVLSAYGFKPIYMEELEFGQQVALMRQAEFIIGPTGAAWTNILFATSGVKALCWMARDTGDLSCFSNIANAVGVEMRYLSYASASADTRKIYYAGYHMEPKLITEWLEKQLNQIREPHSIQEMDDTVLGKVRTSP